MKFNLSSASGDEYESVGLIKNDEDYWCSKEIEISSLSELEEIQSKTGHDLVVDFHLNRIVIYDDYIE